MTTLLLRRTLSRKGIPMRIKLDMPMELREIAYSIGVKIPHGFLSEPISFIATDSRMVQPGDLYFALGRANDKESDFTEEAKRRGATVITEKTGEGFISVRSSASTLGKLAAHYKSKLTNLKNTVLITGSVGKSTTKEFCKTLLSSKYTVHSNEGNLNNLIGLPISILKAQKNCEILVLEAGMNRPAEISRLSLIAKPDIGIITNIGTAHIGILGSRENIAKAKLEITDGLKEEGLILYPEAEPLLYETNGLRIGFSGESCDYSVLPRAVGSSYTDFEFFKGGKKLFDGRLNIGGVHFTEPLAYAISVSDILKMSKDEIKTAVSLINSDALHAKYVELGDFTVLDDSYNASAESVIAALARLSLFKDRGRSALLGDMLELGRHSGAEHERIGEAAAGAGLNALYIYGEYSEYVMHGALRGGMDKNRIFINKDILSPDITAEQITKNHKGGEIILFKASHALNLSRICDLLKERAE